MQTREKCNKTGPEPRSTSGPAKQINQQKTPKTMKTNVKINTLIGEFMGYEIISYHGSPMWNGNKYAKTIGELKKLWGGLRP